MARFSSGVCSTFVEGAIPADNAGGTVGSDGGRCIGKGGGGCVGGTGWPVRREGRRGGDLGRIALLGSQGIVIGDRVEERDRPPRLPVCKAGVLLVGREGDGLTEDEACCCV